MDSEGRADLNESNWLLNEFSGSSSISETDAKILHARTRDPDASNVDKELINDFKVSDDAAWNFVGAEVEPLFLGTSSTSQVLQPAFIGNESLPSITVNVCFKEKMVAAVHGGSLQKRTYSMVSSPTYAANLHQSKLDEDKSTLTALIAPLGGEPAKTHTFLQQADSVDEWNCRKRFNLSLRSPKIMSMNEPEDSLVLTAMKKAAQPYIQDEDTMNIVMIAGIDYPIDGNARGAYYTVSSNELDAEMNFPQAPVQSSGLLDDSVTQENQISWCARDVFISYDGQISNLTFAPAALPPSQPVVCGVDTTSQTSEGKKRLREPITLNEDDVQRLKTLVRQIQYSPEEVEIASTTNLRVNEPIFGAECPVSTTVTCLDSVIVSTSSASSCRSKETTGEIVLEPQGGASSSFARALPRNHTFLRGLSSIDIESEDDDDMHTQDDHHFASNHHPIQGFYDQNPVRFDFKMFRDLRLEDF